MPVLSKTRIAFGLPATALAAGLILTSLSPATAAPGHTDLATQEAPGATASATAQDTKSTLQPETWNKQIPVSLEATTTSLAGRSARLTQPSVLTTPEIKATPFTAAGLTWKDTANHSVERVELRVHEDGQWSPWSDQEIVETDNGSQATEGLLANHADAAQARVHTTGSTAPNTMKMALVGDAPATSRAAVGPQAAEATPKVKGTAPKHKAPSSAIPKINPRSAWNPNEKQTLNATQNQRISAFVVHHTAGSNNYKTKAQAEAQIRADWNYHTNILNWGDLGYHIMIDKFGNVYEGRRGSINTLPLGTHAAGFNTDTYSVSLLGNYETAKPSAAMMLSLRKVLAWKAYEYGVDTSTKVSLTSRALPGSTSRYKKGTKVTLPRIFGHISTSYTACPGQYVIPKLPALRTNVASDMKKIKAQVAASASAKPSPKPSAKPTAKPSPKPTPKPSTKPKPKPTPKPKPAFSYKDKNVADYFKQTSVSTPIYAKPSTTLGTKGKAPKKAKVRVTHTTTVKNWYKITYAGKTGYLPTSRLSKAAGYADKNVADYYKLVKHASPVYAGTGQAWGKVKTLKSHQRITITHKTTRSGWYKVKFSGGTGYLWKSHLHKAPGFATKNTRDRQRTLKDTTPVYSGAGQSWGRTATLKKNQRVTVTHSTTRAGWHRIVWGKKSGYIWKSHLK